MNELENLGVKNAKEVADWLNKDSIPDTGLYHYQDPDGVHEVYVGITNNFDIRAARHGDRFGTELTQYSVSPEGFSEGATALSRNQARALEQALIEKCGRIGLDGDASTLVNSSDSIRRQRSIYEGAVTWAKNFGNANLSDVTFS